MKYDSARTGAFAGIVSALAFTMLFMLAVYGHEGYNPGSNFLSDLGTGTSSLLFNFGLMLSGALGILFGYGLAHVFVKTARVGAKMLIAAGVLLIGTGIFPEQYGAIHTAVSASFFLLSAVSIIIIGTGVSYKRLRYFSFAAGLLPFAYVFTGLPIVEHIAVFGMVGWELLAGVYMMKKISSQNP